MKRGEVIKGSKTALVTGASSGIGFHYAKELGVLGYNLVLVSDGEEKLLRAVEELRAEVDVQIDFRAMDLAQVDSAERLFEWCRECGFEIDVLINNAGMFIFCDTLNVEINRLERLILLHDMTLANCCRLFGEDMARRGVGDILNLS